MISHALFTPPLRTEDIGQKLGKHMPESAPRHALKIRKKLWILFAGLGLLFLLIGLFQGQDAAVLRKAIRICLECIGIA